MMTRILFPSDVFETVFFAIEFLIRARLIE